MNDLDDGRAYVVLHPARDYCARVDTLFNHDGVHVIDVGWNEDQLRLTVETVPTLAGCPSCGVIAASHGRRVRRLHDIPAFGAPVEVLWRVRRYRCGEPLCPGGVFTESGALATARAKLTTRAAWWAIGCLRDGTASVAALARRLGVDWHTLWEAIKPLLHVLASDPARFEGVRVLGVDEHIWHHAPRPGNAGLMRAPPDTSSPSRGAATRNCLRPTPPGTSVPARRSHSTTSSNSTAASPAASAIQRTTDYG